MGANFTAVGFDTFDTAEASTVSLTLRSKHRFVFRYDGADL